MLVNNFTRTDLTKVDVFNISNYVLEEASFGTINFSGTVNFNRVDDVNSDVTLSENKIAINTTGLPVRNKSALLELFNLPFSDPRILRDGSVCSDAICTKKSYTGGTFVFNVTHFSEYTAEEIPTTTTPCKQPFHYSKKELHILSSIRKINAKKSSTNSSKSSYFFLLISGSTGAYVIEIIDAIKVRVKNNVKVNPQVLLKELM